ncbi:MAG: pyruvate kinase [Saprospiraceae bacterium]|jgi:pyruvate kinase
MRRTKIVASLGPATDDKAVMTQLIKAGVNVVRINFSHGDPEEHTMRVELVREVANELGITVAVLGDLQGPKIRIERFKNESVVLSEGDKFTLSTTLDKNQGYQEAVGISYQELVNDVKPGNVLILDDGNIALEVTELTATEIHTKVVIGGKLSNNKGINLQGGGLSAGALTAKDKVDIKLAAKLDVDYLAISFVRDAKDIHIARGLMRGLGSEAAIVAKIERKEALDNIDQIIKDTDVIMIARGDLGVEIGDENLPSVQKLLIRKAREANRVAITATQMMQSMVESPLPTRAEVSDVANAVLDGTDAVMLSAETAVGKYPVKVIEAMHRICIGSEGEDGHATEYVMGVEFGNAEESIAMSTMFTAKHFSVAAIIALTESGRTALLMSRTNAYTPIFAMTRSPNAARKICMYRGVEPISFDVTQWQSSGINRAAVESLKKSGFVADGEQIIITRGDSSVKGRTNTMKIVRVGEVALQ